MQLNKASKKTRNIADETTAPAPETNAGADVTATPRTTRSSKTKKTETAETGSVKHHHKGTSAVMVDAATEQGGGRTGAATAAAPARVNIANPAGIEPSAVESKAANAFASAAAVQREVSQEEIATLAYSYWIARGYAPGDPAQDWLRAERELTSKR